MQNVKNPSTDAFFEAILTLRDVDECYKFFEDICTVKEIKDMAQRLYIAALLEKGMNYQTISQTVEASSATISRVNRCLNYGTGGYHEVLAKLRALEEEK